MRNVRFLVVDDSPLARKLVTTVLQKSLGAEQVHVANDGQEAIMLLERQAVDFIVSDWNMDNVDGAELLAYVRKHEKHSSVPFVMITTNNSREAILKALQLGVSQYLVKPFTPSELEQKIRSSWNASSKRGTERHSDLPEHRIILKADGKVMGGQAVNLSKGGALVRVKYTELMRLYKPFDVSIHFEGDEQKRWDIAGIPGNCVRLEAEDNRFTCLAALALDASGLSMEMDHVFNDLLKWLQSRAPGLIAAEPSEQETATA